MEMVSGATHDAKYMADRAPTAMIFVPSEKGISHNELEHTEDKDLAAGTQILCDALLSAATMEL